MVAAKVRRVVDDIWEVKIKGKEYRSKWEYSVEEYVCPLGWVTQDGSPLHVDLVEIANDLVRKFEDQHRDKVAMELTVSSQSLADELWSAGG